jgi:formylglycine-generating enzyme required for sulfatase activity
MTTTPPYRSKKPIPIIRYIDRQAQFFTEGCLILSPGQTSLDMVYIPPGTFLMGSPKSELGRFDAEGPQHSVTLAEPFFMGKYAVTQAQWRAATALPQVKRELNPNPSKFEGDNRPVEQVSWEDATEFCKRLDKATGRPYRLPTEAEWEYACRAGTTTPFHFGETITTDLANYRGEDWEYEKKVYPGNYGEGPYGEFRKETTDVGSFNAANGFGLYDMHGNAWEWCSDRWCNNYEVKLISDEPEALLDSFEGDLRVIRGGSWDYYPGCCRSARRYGYARNDRDYDLGFRVVGGVASSS